MIALEAILKDIKWKWFSVYFSYNDYHYVIKLHEIDQKRKEKNVEKAQYRRKWENEKRKKHRFSPNLFC